MFLESERLYYRNLEESDLTEIYRGWMNDYDVTRYFETRFFPCTQDDFYNYWVEHYGKKDEPWLGIFLKENNGHIGNIKLGPINWIHRRSDLSLWIGLKELWGHGYGSEAIRTISDYAFDRLNLYKLTAGIYQSNKGSMRAFEKAGFHCEAVLHHQVWCEGAWTNILLMAKFNV